MVRAAHSAASRTMLRFRAASFETALWALLRMRILHMASNTVVERLIIR
jgi:hypothetical protein